MNFFDMDLNQLPKWATSFKYKKNNAYIMGLCLTYRVNLKLSLRQTVQALKEIHGIEISHTMVNNYAKTAAVLIRPFVDSYDYNPSHELAAQQFKLEKEWDVFITQVIGLTNDDEVSKKFRPFKQLIERLNRTFKESYRITCGYGTEAGAVHSISLWVAYYNFLRPHEISGGKEPLNKVELLEGAGNMPGKWQLLIYLGQQTILKQQSEASISS